MQSTWFARTSFFLECSIFTDVESQQLKALDSLQAFEESADWALLSLLCDDFHLHISVFIYFIYLFMFLLQTHVRAVASGGPCVPEPHIWNRCLPISRLVPGCYIHPMLYFENVAPLLVFGPSFWFLPPPAGKSWRRAWLMFHITKGNRITQERKND